MNAYNIKRRNRVGSSGRYREYGVAGVAKLATGSIRQTRDFLDAVTEDIWIEEFLYGIDPEDIALDPEVAASYGRREHLYDYARFAREELRRRVNGEAPWPTSDDVERDENARKAAEHQHLDLARLFEELGVDMKDFHPFEDVLLGPCPFGPHGADRPVTMILDPIRKTWECMECTRCGTARDFVDYRLNLRGDDLDRYMESAIARARAVVPPD